MPIEIRELIIKATVTPEGAASSMGALATSDNGVPPGQEIINTCVEKVLEILKDKHER